MADLESRILGGGARVAPSIARAGDAAVSRFLRLVPNARPADTVRTGDVDLTGPRAVEIKLTHAVNGGTINQVRAVRFLPCAVWTPHQGKWLVFSADEIVLLASEKVRGQHTDNPFESCSINLASVDSRRYETATDEVLPAAIARALTRGDSRTDLRRAMERLADEVSAVSEHYKTVIRGAAAVL